MYKRQVHYLDNKMSDLTRAQAIEWEFMGMMRQIMESYKRIEEGQKSMLETLSKKLDDFHNKP